MEEAAGSGQLDADAHGALLAHLTDVAEAEVLSRHELVLDRLADDVLVVGGSERRTGDLALELRQRGRRDELAMLRALDEHFGRDREARRDALAEARERGARILARGPRGPDEAQDETRERCARFLADTSDAAAELSLRVRHAIGAADRGLLDLLRALSPEPLEPLVAPRTRARRLGSVFEALGLGRELGRCVSVERSRRLALAPRVVSGRGRSTLFVGAIEVGLASERAFMGGLGQALALALVSPMTAIEHRHPALGTASAALGALFADTLGERALIATLFAAGAREERTLRTASHGQSLLGARLACARVLITDPGLEGDAEARERAAEALAEDPGEIPIELALPCRQSHRRDLAEARARLAALALVPALRERYDADFYRNPRFADFVRGAAARGGALSAEGLVADAGGRLHDASQRATEIVC